jgi:hypothetical protein
MVLKCLKPCERRSSGNHLVAEAGLILLEVVVLVDLLVVFFFVV